MQAPQGTLVTIDRQIEAIEERELMAQRPVNRYDEIGISA